MLLTLQWLRRIPKHRLCSQPWCSSEALGTEAVLRLTEAEQEFVFEGVEVRCCVPLCTFCVRLMLALCCLPPVLSARNHVGACPTLKVGSERPGRRWHSLRKQQAARAWIPLMVHCSLLLVQSAAVLATHSQPSPRHDICALQARPVPSLLRGFSAPVKMRVEGQTEEDLVFLLAHDSGTRAASRPVA